MGAFVTTRDDTEHISEELDLLDLKVLTRLAAGQRYEAIAAAEYVSSRTVCRMVRNLKKRTGVNSLAALCAEATRRGWLPPQDADEDADQSDREGMTGLAPADCGGADRVLVDG
jgi:DNA-binding CsgD family transcriptional regulator